MNSHFGTRRDPQAFEDPREQEGAQVIDLATRAVLPQVARAKGGSDLGLAAGVAVVGLLGALIAGFIFGGGASFLSAPISMMSVLWSVVGAIILLLLLRLFRGGFRGRL